MLHRLGYVAIALSLQSTTNRTCRLSNATPKRLRELIRANLDGLAEVLQFNVRHRIGLYRISSQIIPFASHPVNAIAWWEEYAGDLARLGRFIRQSDLRVSMHPGQFTALSTPNQETLAAALRDLDWHVRFLEALGMDSSHKVIVHVGGTYGDKAAAMGRFLAAVGNLPPHHRERLVVENDERSYTVDDVLRVAERSGLPVVFDWLHHQINPGPPASVRGLLQACWATWSRERDGLPKVHFSSPRAGGPAGAHDDWVDADEFVRFLAAAPDRPFDCMLEAKRKELALFRLRRELAARGVRPDAAA